MILFRVHSVYQIRSNTPPASFHFPSGMEYDYHGTRYNIVQRNDERSNSMTSTDADWESMHT